MKSSIVNSLFICVCVYSKNIRKWSEMRLARRKRRLDVRQQQQIEKDVSFPKTQEKREKRKIKRSKTTTMSNIEKLTENEVLQDVLGMSVASAGIAAGDVELRTAR